MRWAGSSARTNFTGKATNPELGPEKFQKDWQSGYFPHSKESSGAQPPPLSITVVLPVGLPFTKGSIAETYVPSVSAFTCPSCDSSYDFEANSKSSFGAY